MHEGRWRNVLRMRARSLLRRQRLDWELEKELRFHLEEAADEAIRYGAVPEEEAIPAARRKLGGIAQIEEECREMRRIQFWENLTQDIRYALRLLVKNPGFTAVLILTMGLGIGATSSIVSVVNGVLLKPLPYREPERVVRIFSSHHIFPKFPINPNDFRDLRTRAGAFESMAAYVHHDQQLSSGGAPLKLSGFAVTADFFRVLGWKPALGREFDRHDELRGTPPIVIISDRLWRTRLDSRRDAVGKTIVLDAVPYTIVGIMPGGFEHPGNNYHSVPYGDTVDLWTPFCLSVQRSRQSWFSLPRRPRTYPISCVVEAGKRGD